VGPNLLFSPHWDRPGSPPQSHKMYRLHSIGNPFTDTNVSSTSTIEYKCIILSDNSRYCFIHTLSTLFQFAVNRDPHTFQFIVLQLILCVDLQYVEQVPEIFTSSSQESITFARDLIWKLYHQRASYRLTSHSPTLISNNMAARRTSETEPTLFYLLKCCVIIRPWRNYVLFRQYLCKM